MPTRTVNRPLQHLRVWLAAWLFRLAWVTPPTRRTSLAAHVSVNARCSNSRTGRRSIFSALIRAGHGDVPLLEPPLRCTQCRQPGHEVVVSGGASRNGTGDRVSHCADRATSQERRKPACCLPHLR